jgi:hypothetical protein
MYILRSCVATDLSVSSSPGMMHNATFLIVVNTLSLAQGVSGKGSFQAWTRNNQVYLLFSGPQYPDLDTCDM